MPRLLQINVDATNGSNGGVAFGINDIARIKDWQSVIAYGRNAIDRENTDIIKIGNRLNVLEHCLESRFFDNHGLSSRIATLNFLKFVDNYNPDIIHLHNIHGYFINYKLLFEYIRRKNIPIVWTLHDSWPTTGHCAMNFDLCDKWKSKCYCCQYHKSYPCSFVDNSEKNYELKKEIFTSINRMIITTVSDFMGTNIGKSFLNKYPCKVVKNGVNINIFRPLKSDIKQKLKIEDKKLLVAVAATWSESKGWNDYIKLSSMLGDKYCLLMVGVNDIQKNKLPQSIVGINKTNDLKELVRIYSAADIVLNLSHRESFGLTTIEGMACGTPGIVYDNTASPELVSRDTGRIVKTGDISGIIDAIEELSSADIDIVSKKCRERVVDNFNELDRYEDYFKIYYELLK